MTEEAGTNKGPENWEPERVSRTSVYFFSPFFEGVRKEEHNPNKS